MSWPILQAVVLGVSLLACGSRGPAPALSTAASPMASTTATPPPVWLSERQRVSVSPGEWFEVQGLSAETAARAPEGPEASAVNVTAAWGDEVVTLTLAGSGTGQRQAEAWRGDRRVALVGVRAPASGRWEVGFAFTAWRTSGPPRTVRVERSGAVPLAGGATLVFKGHAHKAVSPGTASPLMVALACRVDGQEIASGVRLLPPAEAEWQWERWRFRLVDYAYDAWMQLEVHDLAPHALRVDP